MKNLLYLLLVIVSLAMFSCNDEQVDTTGIYYASTSLNMHKDELRITRPGDEMFEAQIPYILFQSKEFVRPDSIEYNNKYCYYYYGKIKFELSQLNDFKHYAFK